MNPWSRARDAERRAAVAEERTAFLEREIDWMRGQVEASRTAETNALKIAANVAYQQAYGMIPFAEVASVPPREQEIREHEELFGGQRAVAKAFTNFKMKEMERFKQERETVKLAE